MQHNQKSSRPVIIVGCPRSGTLLTARIIGICKNHFLITEHTNKAICPEDRSGIIDSQLWWWNFEFEKWDDKANRPLVETPIYSQENIFRVRNIYHCLGSNKRLVIKNPAHLTRISFLKEVFPDALFVFCVRNPWHNLQSMFKKGLKVKGKEFFFLRTKNNYNLHDDFLLKAASSWQESIDIFIEQKDENWIAVKYEDLIFNTRNAVWRLYNFIGNKDELDYNKAIFIPRKNPHDYYIIKKYFQKSKFKTQVLRAIEGGCKLFEYSISPDSVSGKAPKYYYRKLKATVKSLIGQNRYSVR